MSGKIVSAAEAVALIPDGAVVAVNCSSGLNTPNAVFRAIGEAFETQGRRATSPSSLPSAPATCTA
jgi:acyl CoA:acetate/3-ketoacid CoA transferase